MVRKADKEVVTTELFHECKNRGDTMDCGDVKEDSVIQCEMLKSVSPSRRELR